MRIVLTGRLTSNTAAFTIENNVREKLSGEVHEPPWGEPVEGVQVRLRAAKAVWKTGATPAFSLDIRNDGKERIDFVRVAEAHCQIELDGQWYGWTEPLVIDAPVWLLKPGEQLIDAITIELNDKWALPKEGNDPSFDRPGVGETC